MTDLMTPRYLVIADYPNSNFNVGDILTFVSKYNVFKKPDCSSIINADDIDKYPHLFRKLSWWENREMREMPDYVHNYVSGYFFKVIKWRIEYGMPKATIRGAGSIRADWLNPITKEEYEQYLKTIKK